MVRKKRKEEIGLSGRRQVTPRDHQGDPASRFGILQEILSFLRRIWYCAEILTFTGSFFHSGFRRPNIVWLAAHE